MPEKSRIKENNDVGDADDIVPLPISTTVTESQPKVTCSTPNNWSATPLASLVYSYCMNEETMSLSLYAGLADEIQALTIANDILKDKIKASKRPIKVLVQRHDKFTWKKKRCSNGRSWFSDSNRPISSFLQFTSTIWRTDKESDDKNKGTKDKRN